MQPLLGSVAHLNVLVSKQILHQRPVHTRHAGVVDGEAIREKVLQLQVLQQKHNELWVFYPINTGGKRSNKKVAYILGEKL